MDYTKNYHLPQWVETDRVLMKDFNQMCSDLEEGLTKNAEEAKADAAKADAHAEEAVTRAAAAHSAANTAQATANAAYCPSNKPYVVGAYTGTAAVQDVAVGFKPSFLIICYAANTDTYNYMLAAGNNANSARLEFLNTGFRVYENALDASHSLRAPVINQNGLQYVYIAFR